MFKKTLAIILSTALVLGILFQDSFAYYVEPTTTIDDILDLGFRGNNSHSNVYDILDYIDVGSNVFLKYVPYQNMISEIYIVVCDADIVFQNNIMYVSKSDAIVYQLYWSFNDYSRSVISNSPIGTSIVIDGNVYYRCNFTQYWYVDRYDFLYCTNNFYYSDTYYPLNLLLGSYNPDTRFLDAYITMSTYGGVKYLCIESDDAILSSTWVSVRYTDSLGPGTYIQHYPFDFFTVNGHSYIKIMPDLISDYEFTVTSVLYSGSSSWGIKEITELDLTFNEDVLPSPIPSAAPVPGYSYYDTTYINYNGGNPEVIYDCFSTVLEFQVTLQSNSGFYFVDEDDYLYQPFSFTYLAIPKLSPQFYYDSFLNDIIYQYDVVFDELYDSYGPYLSFDRFYGTGMYQDLLSDINTYFNQTGSYDLSPILEEWFSVHTPLCYQLPYDDEQQYVVTNPLGTDCSMIVSDSFYFKQTNYLLGDTGNILSELSERFFKVDGFSDSLFQNLSSLYNLNLQFYDSSLQALTGLSYWLNDNDISSNLSDISSLLSSVDNYLSSVDGKLNYLVTIDSDINDLLEWFQNQEDSDVFLILPEFNPSILIDVYGQNIGDLVGFFQDFINVLPDFDFSDFPNFFDYAADLVDDVAGQDNDVINDLYRPYDYSDSGLHGFGWD